MMNSNDNNDIVEKGLITDIEDSRNNAMLTSNDYDDTQHRESSNKSPSASVILTIEGSNTASRQQGDSILGTTTNNNKTGEASVNSLDDDDDDDNNDESFSKEDWNSQQSTIEENDNRGRNQSNKQGMATISAKREYNRMNAARARQRAKTQLYAYQKQIQELDVEICTLREVNTSLKATLQSLQQENIRLMQNLDNVKKERHSQNTATTYASVPIQIQQPPSFMDRNATYTSSPVVNSANTTSLQDTLMQIYLAGVAVQQQQQQQSSASPQPNQTSTPQQIQPQSLDSSNISMSTNMNWPLLQPTTTTVLNQQQYPSQQPQQLHYANPNLSLLANNVDASQLGQQLMTALLSIPATTTTGSNNTNNTNTTGISTYTNDASNSTSNP